MESSSDAGVLVQPPQASSPTASELTRTITTEGAGQVDSKGQYGAPLNVPATEPIHPIPGAEAPVASRSHWNGRRIVLLGAVVAALLGAAYYLTPMVETAFNTVSTDDAYVNGHVTFVAPRVAGARVASFSNTAGSHRARHSGFGQIDGAYTLCCGQNRDHRRI